VSRRSECNHHFRKYLVVLGAGADKASQQRLNAISLLNKINTENKSTKKSKKKKKHAADDSAPDSDQEDLGARRATTAEIAAVIAGGGGDKKEEDPLEGDGSHYSGILGESLVVEATDDGNLSNESSKIRRPPRNFSKVPQSPQYVRDMTRPIQNALGLQSADFGNASGYVTMSLSETTGLVGESLVADAPAGGNLSNESSKMRRPPKNSSKVPQSPQYVRDMTRPIQNALGLQSADFGNASGYVTMSLSETTGLAGSSSQRRMGSSSEQLLDNGESGLYSLSTSTDGEAISANKVNGDSKQKSKPPAGKGAGGTGSSYW
jgi:hypothetical protein